MQRMKKFATIKSEKKTVLEKTVALIQFQLHTGKAVDRKKCQELNQVISANKNWDSCTKNSKTAELVHAAKQCMQKDCAPRIAAQDFSNDSHLLDTRC